MERAGALQRAVAEADLGGLVLSSPENIYYISGFWGYVGDVGENFGRPTLVLVPASGDCVLITPRMEQEYAEKSTWIKDIRVWVDGVGGEYGPHLADLARGLRGRPLGIEKYAISARVIERLSVVAPAARVVDGTVLVARMRMIKDEYELGIMRAAGKVAVAMGEAAIAAIRDGVPEYEITLAAMVAGTRKSAELFGNDEMADPYMSPVISNLMIMSSGPDITMPHKRPTIRRVRKGESVYLCFCTTAGFKGYHLTYDRQVMLGEPTPRHLKLHERVMAAQAAALAALRPGIRAEAVHAAARKVVEEAGYRVDYRTGRGLGLSFLEPPEFKDGDTTVLQAGMVFSVDGGGLEPGFYGTRVGDSVVITESSYELLTEFPREIRVVGV